MHDKWVGPQVASSIGGKPLLLQIFSGAVRRPIDMVPQHVVFVESSSLLHPEYFISFTVMIYYISVKEPSCEPNKMIVLNHCRNLGRCWSHKTSFKLPGSQLLTVPRRALPLS